MLDRLPDTVLLQCLHREVHLHSGAIPMFGKTIRPPSIISIIENTCRNADIASATQVLVVDDWLVGNRRRESFTTDPVTLKTLLQTAKLSPDQESWWREALDACHQDAWIALLLLQLPNLRKLEIRNMEPGSPYLQSILTRLTDPNDPLTGLTQLSELKVSPAMFGHDFFLSSFIPFAQLPAIQKFHIGGAIDSYPPPPPALFKAASESIRRRAQANGTNTSMGWGISPAQAQYLENISRSSTLAPSVLFPALTAAKPSLQSLWMTTTHRIRHSPRDIFTQDLPGIPIGNLHDLPSLRALRMRVENILSITHASDRTLTNTKDKLWDILPHTLESLFLEDCDRALFPEIINQLQRMLHSREEAQRQELHQETTLFPYLKTVVLQQPREEADRTRFEFPPNMKSISREMMEDVARHRMAENDLQPEVWKGLMEVKEKFGALGVEVRVVDKMRTDGEFLLR
ncbi:hypothetical protein BO94DRAFT_566970 [Aspergillus sclerotioniger CBS 115572]|uniref:Uncharacterized protein n=1 Tax=Aspergillus sclerotioniger CBS 115572 TaxID=1450535 RepID=A0A317WI44_9EURO|nr:hypothetical protein BO94DRAFT_566970 [Aspergillus sclerotioniger CBS 115572]PWY83880.1 hypothetical protein BO94DRAFT_566970 [Aspergillus sclerotioniger CBS 115572]